MTDELPPSHGQFLVYEAEDGKIKIDVRFEGETVWLTQGMMAELFQTSQQNISQHVLNIYEEEELPPESTHKKFLSVRQEGARSVKRLTDFYNLDMIISVGYRVKSQVATRFRIWATQRLREYIVKGFTLDDERLKNPQQPFDYFEELTRRIQDIRTSERRFYRKVADIYATSVDYDPTQDISIEFFKMVQNRMHWAISGMTAAEIVHARADARKPNMGLTTWRGDPWGPGAAGRGGLPPPDGTPSPLAECRPALRYSQPNGWPLRERADVSKPPAPPAARI